nr:sensor domain-containing phosphodiesterase [Propionibacteriales bacterium]
MNSNHLMTAVAELSRAATGDFAIDDMLRNLCEVAANALAVDAVGVMVAEGTKVRFVHARPSGVIHVERMQEVLQAGPCALSIDSGEPVIIADLTSDRRWPQYVAAAGMDGWGAVVAMPLVSRGRTWGALDLYRQDSGPWSSEEVIAARLLADVAVSYIVMATDRDITRAAQDELSHRSMHDQLTGLPNRALLFDRLEHALTLSRRRDSAVAVVFVDLDRFKQINDTFGHAAGDSVLKEVARRMLATLRQGDTLARLAGDEFVLVCEYPPHRTDEELGVVVGLVTERIVAVLQEPIRVAHLDLTVSASIGVAVTTDAAAAEDMLHDADTAMYRAKEAGRGRVVIHDQAFRAARGYDRQLEREVVHALDRGELRVFYQPIVAAGDRRVIAVEALVRWQHPQLGLLTATEFIRLAESTGAIARIGRWVLDQA